MAEPLVLVVEDEFLLRLSAVAMLEDAGSATLQAGSADRAIEQLEAHAGIRAVFTDINMPGGMSGAELARLARLAHPGLRVLMTSGEAVPDPAWLASGIHYLNKPYDRRSLLAAIDATARAVA